MILKPFSSYLSAKIGAGDTYLALSTDELARLKTLVPAGEEIILTLSDGLHREYITVKNANGTLVATRGVDSDSYAFPKGTCVFFENSVPVTKWIVCNYQCCEGDCPIDAVKSQGAVLPEGKVNNAWKGSAVFSGDLPMVIGVTGLPAWCKAEQQGNYLYLSGTPTAVGTYHISIAACNDLGRSIAIQSGDIEIKEE
jgi:hypothetical protein